MDVFLRMGSKLRPLLAGGKQNRAHPGATSVGARTVPRPQQVETESVARVASEPSGRAEHCGGAATEGPLALRARNRMADGDAVGPGYSRRSCPNLGRRGFCSATWFKPPPADSPPPDTSAIAPLSRPHRACSTRGVFARSARPSLPLPFSRSPSARSAAMPCYGSMILARLGRVVLQGS